MTDAFNDKILQNLAKARIFRGLTGIQLSKIIHCFSSQNFSSGAVIIRQNEQTTKVYLIVEGEVGIELEFWEQFESATIANLGSGESIGEFTLLGSTRRTASATALSPVTTLTASSRSLLTEFEKHPEIGLVVFKNLCTVLADRIVNLNGYTKKILEENKVVLTGKNDGRS